MQERTNIWGKFGCDLPNGKLCHACCVLPNIELEGVYVSVGKPANSPCPYLAGSDGKTEQGCSKHLNEKPEACKTWHCEAADLNSQLELIAEGLSLDLVNTPEATSSASVLLGSLPNPDGFIKYNILDKAAALSKITHKRALVVRDVVET
jgi:hypothetical protein